MFIIKFFLIIIGGVCRLLLIVGLGCYLVSVGSGAVEQAFSDIDRQQAEELLQASYDLAAEQFDTTWRELSKYKVIVVKEEV